MKKKFCKLFITLPHLAYSLSDQKYLSVLPLYMKFLFFSILWSFGVKKKALFVFSFLGKSFSFTLQDSTDIAALEEIYLRNEYLWDEVDNPSTILDLGANYGDTALYYHIRYPEALIYAVEACPESYNRLLGHVKNIPQIVPIHAAISDFVGEIELFLMGGSSLGHSLVQRNKNMQSIFVPTYTLASVMEEYNKGEKFDLIKFDIEGAEEKMFKDLRPIEYAKAYIGELHFDLMNWTPSYQLEFFNQFNIQAQKLNNKNRVIIRALCKEKTL